MPTKTTNPLKQLLFALFTILSGSLQLNAQITLTDTTDYQDVDFVACSPSEYEFQLDVPALDRVVDDTFAITLNLPSYFTVGSIAVTSPSSASVLTEVLNNQQVTYSIHDVPLTDTVINFTIVVNGNCDGFSNNISPIQFTVDAEHLAAGMLSSASVTTDAVNQNSAQLDLLSVTNQFYTQGTLGGTFVRCFTYINNGVSDFNGTFGFTDTSEYNPTSPNNGSVEFLGIDATGNVSILNSTQAPDKVSIDLNISGLANGDTFQICDTVTVLRCKLNKSYTFFEASYGCTGEPDCQIVDDPLNPQDHFTTATFDPADKPAGSYSRIDGTDYICPGVPDQNIIRVINTGQGAASGIRIRAFQYFDKTMSYIDRSSIEAYMYDSFGNMVVIPSFTTVINGSGSVLTGEPRSFDIHVNQIIPPGDSIFIKYNREWVCPQESDYGQYFNTNIKRRNIRLTTYFKHPCGEEFVDDRNNNRGLEFELGQVFNNLTGTVVDQQQVWFEVQNTSRLKLNQMLASIQNRTSLDANVFRLEVELELDSGLCLVNDSILLRGNQVGYDIPAESVTLLSVPGTAPGPGRMDIVQARFELPGNFFAGTPQEITNDYLNFFNDFSVMFKLQAKCEYSPPGGFAAIKENVYAIWDETCSPDCKIPLATVGNQVNINCPGCYLPGWNLSQLNIQRVNVGYQDADNNHYPDVIPLSNSPLADPADANLKRAMIGDTIEIHYVAHTSNGENLLFSTGNVGSPNNIGFDYTYGRLYLQGDLMNHVEFLGAEGYFIDTLGATPIAVTAPLSTSFTPSQFFIEMDSTDLQNYGASHFQSYNIGNAVDITMKFRIVDNIVSGSPDPYFGLQQVNGFYYMSGTDFIGNSGTAGKIDVLTIHQAIFEDTAFVPVSDRKDYLYWCTGWEGRMNSIGAYFASSTSLPPYPYGMYVNPGAASIHPCYKEITYSAKATAGQDGAGVGAGALGNNQAALNSFAYELRNLWDLDSISFMFPEAYEIDRVEMEFFTQYLDQQTGTHGLQDCSPPYTYFNLPLSYLTYKNDSVAQIDIGNLMRQPITDRLSACLQNTSFYDETGVIRIRPVFKMKNCGTTPAFSPFTDYEVVSHWSNFPFSSTGDTTVTHLISGNWGVSSIDWQVNATNVSSLYPNNDQTWDVNIAMGPNQINQRADKGFFYFESIGGNINITDVRWVNPNMVASPLTLSNGQTIYRLGKLGNQTYWGGRLGNVRVSAEYDCSNYTGPDSVMLVYGNNCYSYPSTLDPDSVCFMDTIYLPLTFETPFLQETVNFPTVVSQCDTSTFQIGINVSGSGNVENINVLMNLPSGIDYVPQSGSLNYDNTMIAPVDANSNVFDLSSIVNFNNGFDEFSPIAWLSFDLATACDYNGEPLSFTITGTNYCGEQLDSIDVSYSPDQVIDNFDFSDLEISSISATPLPDCIDGSQVSVTVVNTGSVPTSGNDTLVINLPNGLGNQDILLPIGVLNPGQSITLDLTAIPQGSALCNSSLTVTASIQGWASTTCSGVVCNNTSIIDQDTVVLAPCSQLDVDAGPDQTICEGEQVTLVASGASTYVWDNGLGSGAAQVVNPSTTTTYTVTGVDANGCENTDQLTVVVNALPVVNAGPDQTICEGEQVTLTASGASTYVWDNGLGSGAAQVVNPSTTTTYTVTGTVANGCENTDQVTVVVNTLPVVNAGPDQTICEGEQVTLVASGASTYVWDNGLGSGAAQVVNPSTTTTYTVTGVDANGCENTDQVTVVVNALPTVDAGPDQTICEGEQVTLVASGASTYVWDNGLGSGAAQVVNPSTTTTYTVTGVDANGCENTDQVTVVVNTLPVVNAGPDQTICEGEQVTLTASGASTYVWDNGLGSGATQVVNPSTTTTYTVTGVDANGCKNTDQVTVVVNPLPVATISGSTSVCVGETQPAITFTGLNGMAPYTFTYSINGGNNQIVTSVGTAATITVPTGSPGTYVYNLVGVQDASSTSCSQIQTGSATVIVNENPTVPIIVTNESCSGNCDGTLTADIGSSVITSYSWTELSSGQAIGNTQTIAGLCAGNYELLVQNNEGCESVSTATIVATGVLPAMQVTNITACEEGPLIFPIPGGAVPGATVEWYLPWQPVGNPTLPTGTAVFNGPFQPATYTGLKVRQCDANGCCSDVQFFDVTIVPSPPTPIIPNVVFACESGPLELSVSQAGILPGATVQWWFPWQNPNTVAPFDTGTTVTLPGPFPPGNYAWFKVRQCDANGCCSDIRRFRVRIRREPPALVVPDITVCEGSPITLTASGSLPAATVQWYAPGDLPGVDQPIPGGATPTLPALPVGNYPGYQVWQCHPNGCCSPVSTFDINVVPAPQAPVVPGVVFACESGPLEITASGVPPGSIVEWIRPNGNIAATGTSISLPGPFPPGTYPGFQVRTCDPVTLCCSPETEFTIEIVKDPPPINMPDVEVCEGETIILSAPGIVPGATVEWYAPGSSSPILGTTVSIGTLPQGTYTYEVVQCLSGCCSQTSTFDIVVTPGIDFPKHFTPGSGSAVSASDGNAIAYDDNTGSLYVAGRSSGTTQFFNPSASVSAPNAGYEFVAKYNECGDLEWANAYGNGLVIPRDIATGPNGDVYVTGLIDGTNIDFGNGYVLNAPQNTTFVHKISPSGVTQWAIASSGGSSAGSSITVDDNDVIYIAGRSSNNTVLNASITFGSVTETFNYNSDIFAAAFDNAGTCIWLKKVGLTSGAIADLAVVESIAVNDDHAFVSGTYVGSIQFESQTPVNLNSTGFGDIYLVKYDKTTGSELTAFNYGSSTSNDLSREIEVDDIGNVYMTGFFTNSVSYPGTSGAINLTSNGGEDAMVLKIAPSGNVVWGEQISGFGAVSSNDHGTGIDLDAANNVYVIGKYRSSALDFGSSVTLSGNSTLSDGYVAKYDNSGNILNGWATNPTGLSASYTVVPWDIAVSSNGMSYVTGVFNGTVDFSSGMSPALTSIGSYDGFIARIAPAGVLSKINANNQFTIEKKGVWYPNPATNKAYYAYDLEFENEAELVVQDVFGRAVYRRIIRQKAGELELDVSNMVEGIYFYEVISGKKQLDSGKFVVH